ncbi:hypothetical protein RclHR1_00420022 [Rhizophagus clarus]|uniref:Uncharacterized protein n=1 Tax=Rhizophagus clarus TaxID=94130 RepID=A0A2Z6RWZ4_9GLOM|nr:hypothetical protein RclHR1_00420022 [Rhizophagus clarus]
MLSPLYKSLVGTWDAVYLLFMRCYLPLMGCCSSSLYEMLPSSDAVGTVSMNWQHIADYGRSYGKTV